MLHGSLQGWNYINLMQSDHHIFSRKPVYFGHWHCLHKLVRTLKALIFVSAPHLLSYLKILNSTQKIKSKLLYMWYI
jgi:hypothetical protein